MSMRLARSPHPWEPPVIAVPTKTASGSNRYYVLLILLAFAVVSFCGIALKAGVHSAEVKQIKSCSDFVEQRLPHFSDRRREAPVAGLRRDSDRQIALRPLPPDEHLSECQKDLRVIINQQNGIDLNPCTNTLRKQFYQSYRLDAEMSRVDAIMCELFMTFQKPMIVIASTRYEIGRLDAAAWQRWNDNLRQIAASPYNTIAANNRNISAEGSPHTRSSSIASVEDGITMRARAYSIDKHSSMSIGARSTKKHAAADYCRLPAQNDTSDSQFDDSYSPMSTIDLDHSIHTVKNTTNTAHTTHHSTIDRSTEHTDEASDPEDPSFHCEDPDEICCPTFFDSMGRLGGYLACTNKSRSLDSVVGMESSRHQLMHTDSSSSLTTLADSDESIDSSKQHAGKLSTGTVLTQRAVILATSTYGMVCASSILIDETLPLFLKLESGHGGFGFDSTQIGTLLSTGAAGMFVLSVVFMPMTHGMSNKLLSKASIALSVPLCLAFPVIALFNNHVLVHMSNDTAHTWLLWPLLILINTFKNLANCFAFTSSVIMVNHSVTDEYLGAVNGLGQSLGALARCLGPAVGGLLWSVATKYDFVYLNFIAVTIVFGLNYYVSYLVPDALDHRKKGKK